MFDTHVDTLYVWAALGTASFAVLGVVAGLPTATPPDATRAAATVDEVTTSPPGSVERQSVDADEWQLTDDQLGLRTDAGQVHARVHRKAVPGRSDRLRAVLAGRPPAALYDSPAEFEAALDRARSGDEWRSAPPELTVRRVVWEGVDVTLVG